MALTGTEHWARGFVWVDTAETTLATTPTPTGATLQQGYLRDADGRLVVAEA